MHLPCVLVRSASVYLNKNEVTYPTYREQLITEVGEKLFFLRVKHVRWLEAALRDEGAVDTRRTLHVIKTVSVHHSVVDLVYCRHFI